MCSTILVGRDHVGPSPVDRARPGSKHHLVVDCHGTPLAVTLTGGNRPDVTRLFRAVSRGDSMVLVDQLRNWAEGLRRR